MSEVPLYMGISLTRRRLPLGPYSRPMLYLEIIHTNGRGTALEFQPNADTFQGPKCFLNIKKLTPQKTPCLFCEPFLIREAPLHCAVEHHVCWLWVGTQARFVAYLSTLERRVRGDVSLTAHLRRTPFIDLVAHLRDAPLRCRATRVGKHTE